MGNLTLKNKSVLLTALILFAAVPSFSRAQPAPYPSLLSFTSNPALSDTAEGPVITDSLSAPFVQTKSPSLAMAFSALLPGAGQIYNESYWKVPIIWGAGAWFVYNWLDLDKSYRYYLHKYEESIAAFPPDGIIGYRENREFYRDERDGFAWYLGILYALNILDAYVDASLYDFKTLQMTPTADGMAVGVRLPF